MTKLMVFVLAALLALAGCGSADVAPSAAARNATLLERVHADFPGSVNWYTQTTLDEQTPVVCAIIEETGGDGPEWSAAVFDGWLAIPKVRQDEVFGGDITQLILYMVYLAEEGCPDFVGGGI